jgi:CO/xanthine dehydrogenase Mo-binding subunit
MSGAIGQEVSRVDGPAKVAGAARYSGEIALAAGTGSTATTPLILGRCRRSRCPS